MSALSAFVHGLPTQFPEDEAGSLTALFSGGLVEWPDSQMGEERLLSVDESAHSSWESTTGVAA